MTPDAVGSALKQLADHWDTPAFDPEVLAQRGRSRVRRTRHRTFGAVVVIALVAAGALTAAQLTGSGNASLNDKKSTPPSDALLQPAVLPPVRVTAINPTHQRIDGMQVLARTAAGRAVTVRATLSFFGKRPAGVQDAALLIAKPGTSGGVSGAEVDSHFRSAELARGPFVAARSPGSRMLSTTAPRGLPPGVYPVFYVFRTILMSGQEPGIYGPFDESGQLGVILVAGK